MLPDLPFDPANMTESDLIALIKSRVPEGLHFEYRPSSIFNDIERAVLELSKEVSGFYNALGGLVVVGFEENRVKGKTYPIALDESVNASSVSSEALLEAIQDCLSIRVADLLVCSVPMKTSNTENVAFVIVVPKGDRALQAGDFRYYRREGDLSQPMRDSEIREVNTRSDGPNIEVRARLADVVTTNDNVIANLLVDASNESHNIPDIVVFRLVLPTKAYDEAINKRAWVAEKRRPEIEFTIQGERRTSTQGVLLTRTYRSDENWPMFDGAGPVEIGSFGIKLSPNGELPEYHPFLVMAAAPQMKTRTFRFAIQQYGNDLMVVSDGRVDLSITLNRMLPDRYFGLS